MGSRKKGEMTIGTIITIVLGIAVLVFLILGFSTGWKALWEKVGVVGGGEVNIDAIRNTCAMACAGQSSDAYCRQVRPIRYGEKISAWNGTGISEITSSQGTCNNMTDGTKYPRVNVAPCPGLC